MNSEMRKKKNRKDNKIKLGNRIKIKVKLLILKMNLKNVLLLKSNMTCIHGVEVIKVN